MDHDLYSSCGVNRQKTINNCNQGISLGEEFAGYDFIIKERRDDCIVLTRLEGAMLIR